MSVHDWSRVEAGIFHDFHHAWIEEIKRALNGGLLPDRYYALAEQHTAGFGPDVLALESFPPRVDTVVVPELPQDHSGGVQVAPPKVQFTDEADLEFYRRKQSSIAVRHVSGDRVVAFVEIVSLGNKSSRFAFRSFVDKAAELINHRIHLLVVDLQAAGTRDPNGIHGAIWEEITGNSYTRPREKPLTLAAYESALTVRAYIEPVAVGEPLIHMPLYLEPGHYVPVPLEETYQQAFAALPRRWREVLEDAG